eukprot:1161001-Pelagomonas_calceolata.AAC.13
MHVFCGAICAENNCPLAAPSIRGSFSLFHTHTYTPVKNRSLRKRFWHVALRSMPSGVIPSVFNIRVPYLHSTTCSSHGAMSQANKQHAAFAPVLDRVLNKCSSSSSSRNSNSVLITKFISSAWTFAKQCRSAVPLNVHSRSQSDALL